MKEHPKAKINTARLADTREERRDARWLSACDRQGAMRRFLGKNKRGYSTEGSTLLPSVLRPRLFGVGKVADNTASYSNKLIKTVSLLIGVISILAITQILNSNNTSAFSLTLTVPDTVTINLNPTTNNGFGEGSSSNLKVKTTSPAGYKLQLGSKSNGTNDLTNGSSKLTSITASTTADNFKNSGAANTWGYKPSKLSGSSNSNYKAAPSGSSVDTLDTTSAANSTDNTYSLGIAAKVNSSTVAGTYTNTFVLTATANTLNYTINYDLNSGTWSQSNSETNTTTNETVQINSTSPTKSGYTFKGWCSSSSITNNNTTNTPSCNGTTYQPSGTYNLTSANNTLNLYAMWQQNVTYRSYTINYYNNFTDAGSPSNMPSTQSGSAASTSSYQVTLSSNTPTLSGYTFQGWCTSSSITNNGTTNTPTCSGTKYQPSNTITISSNSQTISLYAMWKSRDGESCSHSGWTGTAKYYGGLCWMWTTYKTDRTWAQAKTDCPTGWKLPSKSDFEALLNAIGNGSQLYNAGWGNRGYYWSSTENENNTGNAYILYVNFTSAGFDNGPKAGSHSVRCVAS